MASKTYTVKNDPNRHTQYEDLEINDNLARNSSQDVPERGQWSSPSGFILSMIAYAVGLGNVWRFPYLCYKNGGGSFLVVYTIFFSLAAVPIFLMEVTIGQYIQRGAMEMWKLCPLFTGVGIGNVVISFMCISYFCVIVSWAIFYIIHSFSTDFPWETCGHWWNDDKCIDIRDNNITNLHLSNSETSVEQFWERRVLKQTSSFLDFGGIQWELLVIMFFMWVIVYFALRKGITKARKFVLFCAIAPYFLLFVLLVRGLTLPGATVGIKYYLIPNVTKLLEPTVWKDAGTQVFYSYGVGFGTLIALGSHNSFNHNCYRDAFILCLINGSTSILAGFAIFSILGYMSTITHKSIADIVKPGVGLAFQAYPEVASNLPLKQLWAVLFFSMITILGLDSQVCMVEGFITALEDVWPSTFRRHKSIMLAIICTIFFILGIPMVTYAGSHWLSLVDDYGASGIALLFVVFFEVMGISWGFGADRVRHAVKEMIGLTMSRGWNLMWKFVSPFVTFALFVFCIMFYETSKYPNGVKYPQAAEYFGLFLSSCSMIPIVVYPFYHIFIKSRKGSIIERVKIAVHPPLDLHLHVGQHQTQRLGDVEVMSD